MTKQGAILLAVPASRVETVIVVGNCGITTPALTLLLERGIGLMFLTSGGA
ncbi:MAG: CRISPR-associated endonuclease Cas1, partial [Chloroflexota bacterium]